MVARQCGDFWTAVYPGSFRSVEVNSCKFRGLEGQSGVAWRWQPQCVRDRLFFLIAVSLHFATKHSRRLDSLSTNAHGLYLVHYNFIV